MEFLRLLTCVISEWYNYLVTHKHKSLSDIMIQNCNTEVNAYKILAFSNFPNISSGKTSW